MTVVIERPGLPYYSPGGVIRKGKNYVEPMKKKDLKGNRVVVSGHPELSQEQSEQARDYTKKVGRIEVVRDPTDPTKTVIRPSSVEALNKRINFVNEFEEKNSVIIPSRSVPLQEQKVSSGVVVNNQIPESSLAPEETLAPVIDPYDAVKNKTNFNPDNVISVQSQEAMSNAEKRNNKFLNELQLIKARLLTNKNSDPYNPGRVVSNVVVPGVIIGAGSFVKGGFQAGKDVFSGKIVTDTGEFLTELASNPKSVLVSTVQDFKKNPVGFVGEQVGYGFVTGKIIKVGTNPSGTVKFLKATEKDFRNKMYRSVDPDYPYKPLEEYDYVTPDRTLVVSESEAIVQRSGVQSTLTGGVVSDAYLESIGIDVNKKVSPLKLDIVGYYYDRKMLKSFDNRLNTGDVVKGSPLRFDNVVPVLSEDLTLLTSKNVLVGEGMGVSVYKEVPFVKEFPASKPSERFVSLREFDVFEPEKKIIYPEILGETKKNVLRNEKNVVDADFVEVQKPIEVFREGKSVQKELKFNDEGGFIRAEIVPGTTTVFELGNSAFNNFKIMKEAPEVGGLSKPIGFRLKPFLLNPSKYDYVSSDKLGQINIVDSVEAQKINSASEVRFEPISTPKYIGEQSIKASQLPVAGFSFKLRQEQKLDLDQEQAFDSTKRFSSDYRRQSLSLLSPKINKFKPEVFVPRLKGKKKKLIDEDLFRVEIRSKEGFLGVGEFKSKKDAFVFGKNLVSNTAKASLRVRDVESGSLVNDSGVLGMKQFYKSYREPGVYVERRGMRIKSLGEKSEITFKGLQALKSKR